MKSNEGGEAAKRAAGERAAREVSDGDVVGLGTGSTAAWTIRTLGDRVDRGLSVEAVATSHQSRALAREAGVPLASLADVARVDMAIDGADQATHPNRATDDAAHGSASDDAHGSTPDHAAHESVHLIKGGGAAHAREKVVAAAADRFLVVVDDTKLASALSHPVPVEVLPDAEASAIRHLRDLGGDPTLRAAERKDGPVVTDNGNFVVDCEFGTVDDPGSLADRLSAVPGVVEHGLFVDLADALVVGSPNGEASVHTGVGNP
jgi:ribose 5-phosphate isomerase A